MNLGDFRRMTAGLPDETLLTYHGYDKGACLSNYSSEDVWLFPKDQEEKKAVVINPASDYDPRAARVI